MSKVSSSQRIRRVNKAELAEVFGVAKATADAWVVDRGTGKGVEWVFDTAAVHRWRLEEKAAAVAAKFEQAGAAGSREDAERRRAVALATLAEIDLDERLGRVVLVSAAAEPTGLT